MSSEQLTLFAEDSLASLTASPATARLVKTKETCGESSPESFTELSRDGLWLKMYSGYCQAKVDGSLDEFSETWPRAGTMRHGRCYELPTLELSTRESVSFLLPTVTANESKGSGRNRYQGSPHFRGAKMSEGLRTCEGDPIYLSPSFAEKAMGFPVEWTCLATP